MIKGFEPRLYQQTIFSTCSLHNTLVVLPTGLGKTNVFLMITAKRLSDYPDMKVMLLGPTRPLIEQYKKAFLENFDVREDEIAVITGAVSPDKRKEVYEKAKIVFSTPQCIENDMITRRVDIKKFSLIGFDEAHRAIDDYAYTFIAKKYYETGPKARLIGLTASPGSDKEKIESVINNLFIEKVEVRNEDDEDVKPYIQETKVSWAEVELPEEYLKIKKYFEYVIKDRLKTLKSLGVISKISDFGLNKKEVLRLQVEVQARIAKGEKTPELMRGISVLAEIIKVEHAKELIESQGAIQLLEYMKKSFDDASKSKSKAVVNLVRDEAYKAAYSLTKKTVERGVKHPKIGEVQKILLKNPESKKIVFSHFRETAKTIRDELEAMGVSCEVFVGQAKKNGTGITQKKQKEIIDDFREGKFEVLIATSVAEEGLDIPNVDLVVFYEPVPSAIRQIQRRGRTGRHSEGQAILLVAKNTRDEAYKWSAYHKENKMYKVLRGLKENKGSELKPRRDAKLSDYAQKEETVSGDVKIVVDHREKANKVVKSLMERGISISLEKLDIGDYLLSDRVCVEYKTVSDFVNSIIDGRLLSQLKILRKYEKPIVLVEGGEDLYSQRNLTPNSIRGAIAAAMITYGIPIYFSKNKEETADLLSLISKKEQLQEKRGFSMHNLKPTSTRQLQEYIVASLPGVGSSLSKPLLKEFKSIKKIFSSEEEDLKKTRLIGDKKAKEIFDIINEDYKDYE
ncbi:DEAD/DEAH box helicase family protein [Candidatus Woesearchaeota archaeon]|nr:DEAD/DEAH box helicase family protein [Candidatus Woesearchaeota archaeon]